MDAASYFKLFAGLLKTNSPTADDAMMKGTLAKLGIVPGQDSGAGKLAPAVAKGVPKFPNSRTSESPMPRSILDGSWKIPAVKETS